jgi:diaminopimelate decarboxylase
MAQIKNADQLQTPCFLLDPAELERSISGFQKALDTHFQHSVIGYSVKTNSTPVCLNLASRMGTYAEVVSYDEYELALICGFAKDKIIYNGPMKNKETFLQTIRDGAIVNIETKRELLWLEELPHDRPFAVGLRLNVNISNISPEDADGEGDNSRFGFSDETTEFQEALDKIGSMPNVRLAGLHVHRTSHSRSVRFYKASMTFACELIRKYRLELDYLDAGGGYFGIFPNKPTYQEYSDAFYQVLSAYGLENLQMIVEPGNALVASCFAFLSEVVDVKHVEDKLWVVTTDGSRNDIDPFYKKTDYLSEVWYRQTTPVVEQQVIGGCTCLEYDRLFSLTHKPLLSVGDRIYYRNVGAYTTCLSPMFIRYIPNVYMLTDDGWVLVREKWTAREYVMKSMISTDESSIRQS